MATAVSHLPSMIRIANNYKFKFNLNFDFIKYIKNIQIRHINVKVFFIKRLILLLIKCYDFRCIKTDSN